MSSSTSHPYNHCLPPTDDHGYINNVEVRWQPHALYTLLAREEKRTGQPRELLKALTEHFLYGCAQRLGNKQLYIIAPPHQFTTHRATGRTTHEGKEHVTGHMEKQNPASVHVYINPLRGNWYQVKVVGETVRLRGTQGIDEGLSWGDFPKPSLPIASNQPSSRQGGSSTSGPQSHGSSTSAAGSSLARRAVQYSEPQRNSNGNWVRFNYYVRRWEPCEPPRSG
ncbi:hypothetical protein F5Y09DRAFT_346169 [Xylaria sp. FL1042]|nr:hypothetical protein F5Y09DRAFT_346169 [Xylaria sp. FL1042]